MDTSALLSNTLFSHFLDHKGEWTMSVTYPVSQSLRAEYQVLTRSHPGRLETHLHYPCFQLYLATSRSILHDANGRQLIGQSIVEILSVLEKIGFFTAFEGIRFEVYNGRNEFGRRLKSMKPNPACLEAIGDHAVGEREERNALYCFMLAVNQHSKSNFAQKLKKVHDSGSSIDEWNGVLKEQDAALNKICSLGSLLSPELARFEKWRKNYHLSNTAPIMKNRRKSLTDMDGQMKTPVFGGRRFDPSASLKVSSGTSTEDNVLKRSNSTGGLQKLKIPWPKQQGSDGADTHVQRFKAGVMNIVPDRRQYLKMRVERLIRQLTIRFHAPIVPTSFFNPPNQPYHSVVLVSAHPEQLKDSLFVMRFGKEVSWEAMVGSSSAVLGNHEHIMQPVTTRGNIGGQQGMPHLGHVLGYHLNFPGLVRSSAIPRGVNQVHSSTAVAWFEHESVESVTDFFRHHSRFEDEMANVGLEGQEDSDFNVNTESEFGGPLTPPDQVYDIEMKDNATNGDEFEYGDDAMVV